jgi:hypothetical protein
MEKPSLGGNVVVSPSYTFLPKGIVICPVPKPRGLRKLGGWEKNAGFLMLSQAHFLAHNDGS